MICAPGQETYARCTVLSNSRTFPGQLWLSSFRKASREKNFCSDLPAAHSSWRKRVASSETSLWRSRSDGRCRRSTLSLKYRSRRNCRCSTHSSRERLLAVITRTSAEEKRSDPSERYVPSCKKRNSFDWLTRDS